MEGTVAGTWFILSELWIRIRWIRNTFGFLDLYLQKYANPRIRIKGLKYKNCKKNCSQILINNFLFSEWYIMFTNKISGKKVPLIINNRTKITQPWIEIIEHWYKLVNWFYGLSARFRSCPNLTCSIGQNYKLFFILMELHFCCTFGNRRATTFTEYSN